MPKLKTKGSVKKRFKVTGRGKIRRQKAFHSHLATGKTRKRKRQLRQPTLLTKTDAKKIQELLHVGKAR